MMYRMVRYFYPDLKHEEMRRFSLLAAIFSLIIGTYWLLRLLKTTIFVKVAFPVCLGWHPQQGCWFQPTAKLWSPIIIFCTVLIYSKLVDVFKKHQLFYIFCSLYALLFFFCSVILLLQDMYGIYWMGRTMLATMGWVCYFATESFGSLVVALFWSFTNSITDSDTAKRAFPFIIAVGQLTAIVAALFLQFACIVFGSLWPILFVATLCVVLIMPLVAFFVRTESLVDPTQLAHPEHHKEKAGAGIRGFFDGLILLCSRSYLLGVLIISTFYEAISQIVEFQMYIYASMSPDYSNPVMFAKFQSWYGVAINFVSFLVALVGTRYIFQRFGIRMTLLVYPIHFFLVLLCLLCYGYFIAPSATHFLWANFLAIILIKGVGYAVNNPTKEIMYIPTSKEAKFKSKSWIDTFGSRFAKAAGARITDVFKFNLADLMVYGSFIGFGLIGIWMIAALFVGRKNQQLIESDTIIE